jgi:hypothetical protein
MVVTQEHLKNKAWKSAGLGKPAHAGLVELQGGHGFA